MSNRTKIYTIYIDSYVSDLRYESYYSYIDESKLERILKCKSIEDRARSIIAHLLSKYMISKKLSIDLEGIILEINEYGKPYLKNQDIYFNVSHSEKMVIGVCEIDEVGIDVEKIQNINLKIAVRYFTNSENQYILKGNSKLNKFYEIWTKKESFIKAVGKGLMIPLNSFNVQDKLIMYNDEKYFTNTLYLRGDYIAAVCMKTEIREYEIVELTVEEFLLEIEQYMINKR